MTVSLLWEGAGTAVRDAAAEGEELWLAPADLERATGWEWKPEGLCREAACVPLPPDAGAWVREGRVSLTRLARHMGWPVAASPAHGIWALVPSHHEVAERLRSLQAPEVSLPDLDGRRHALSQHRGRKVFLLAWAPW